jgi:23S rRNA pseudouridine1911/1915/1917 synthase
MKTIMINKPLPIENNISHTNISKTQEDVETPEPYWVTIPNELAGNRIDAAMSVIIPELSRNKIINWIKSGHILVDNLPIKPASKIFGGETVLITPTLSSEVLAYTPENIDLEIIHQDEHIIIINKPRGLIVHPGSGNWSGTLLNGLLYHFPELRHLPRAGIVHRLDKDTSGLMVVARTLLAQTSLVQQLQNRSVTRLYRAIVEGHTLQNGVINKNIGRDLQNRIKMAVLEIGGKEAITYYRTIQHFEKFSYLECKLATGRTHQIRVHLKSIGHPIAGDTVYGTKKNNYPENIQGAILALNRQALHAIKLRLVHPATKEIMEFRAPLALDIQYLLNELKNNEGISEGNESDALLEASDDTWEFIYVKE